MKADNVLLSNWAIELTGRHRGAVTVRKEILERLRVLGGNLRRIKDGEPLPAAHKARALEAARLLLYGRDVKYRRAVNKTADYQIPPEPDPTAAEHVVKSLIRRIEGMEVRDWQEKLKVLLHESDA